MCRVCVCELSIGLVGVWKPESEEVSGDGESCSLFLLHKYNLHRVDSE